MSGKTQTREALASLAEKAAMYDADGVDILFINSSKSFKNMRVCVYLIIVTVKRHPYSTNVNSLLPQYDGFSAA